MPNSAVNNIVAGERRRWSDEDDVADYYIDLDHSRGRGGCSSK